MKIVVVESPAKAKTINKYLGPGYEVLASFGHVRDLPAKDGSVDPEHDFKMLWEVDDKSNKRLNDIARAMKGAEKLILATDPDREGEAISWHVLEVLKEKHALKSQPVERVVFNAITKQAVADAMKNPRQIDGALVDAYLARRALDYLVGFTLSPVLWRKLPGARARALPVLFRAEIIQHVIADQLLGGAMRRLGFADDRFRVLLNQFRTRREHAGGNQIEPGSRNQARDDAPGARFAHRIRRQDCVSEFLVLHVNSPAA